MDIKSFGNPPREGGGGRPPGNLPLARQGSIYSLTFDELQTTMGGSVGKDFGSMNMDELLKNIWSAEEAPPAGYHHPGGDGDGGGGFGGTGLQRQGSLTLPRTISQKTVDEVWKGLSKVNDDGGIGPPRLPPRQPTLGEMTIEEFLVKAGVVREETQFENGLFSNLPNPQNAPGFGALGFQPGAVNPNDATNQITFQSGNLPLSANGFRSAQKQHPVFPKQTNFGGYGGPVIRNGIVGLSDAVMNGNLVTTGGLQGGMVGLGGGGAVTVAAGSPAVSSDAIGKSNGDTSSVSPAPYVFSGLLRGRKSGGVEKVVERRQRRMIKNRESAARSRARKQTGKCAT